MDRWIDVDHYVLFDCPGQVELYTFHESMEKIVWHMTNKWDYRVCKPFAI